MTKIKSRTRTVHGWGNLQMNVKKKKKTYISTCLNDSQSFVELASNNDMHGISVTFDIRPDRPSHSSELRVHEGRKFPHRLIMEKISRQLRLTKVIESLQSCRLLVQT